MIDSLIRNPVLLSATVLLTILFLLRVVARMACAALTIVLLLGAAIIAALAMA